MPQKCCQCDKPAVVEIGDNYFCVDCDLKLQWADNLAYHRHALQKEEFEEDLYNLVGLRPPRRQLQRSTPTINTSQTIHNNIRMDRSTVGAVNTGDMKKVDVRMGQTRKGLAQRMLEKLLSWLTHK